MRRPPLPPGRPRHAHPQRPQERHQRRLQRHHRHRHHLDTEQRELEIALDDGDTATYTFDELDDVLHAYAITVHRAQGSEYPIVVIPLTTTGAFILRRNLLYTAVTRGKHKVILVGEEEALRRALATAEPHRNTTLTLRLHAALGNDTSLPAPLRPADGQIALC
ncbi:superfamily I DNA and RNA helicase [Streptacidiphilus sp. MAP12-16]|uniref:ATP-binding domain-containing protein n=1 Tax=Streptacidiphilus sp. MAP12-16 TaxID=3156300 RepID=UPI0035128CB6